VAGGLPCPSTSWRADQHRHLFAFVLVSLGVMILRIKRPDIPRSFKGQAGHSSSDSGRRFSGGLMYTATTHTLIRLFRLDGHRPGHLLLLWPQAFKLRRGA